LRKEEKKNQEPQITGLTHTIRVRRRVNGILSDMHGRKKPRRGKKRRVMSSAEKRDGTAWETFNVTDAGRGLT